MTLHSDENAGKPQLDRALQIASSFDLPRPLDARDFPERGNINQQTYLILAGPSNRSTQYLLQMLNPGVFSDPRAVMEAMIACIQAQKKALAQGIPGAEGWETIQLVPTKEGKDYLETSGKSGRECWRMMVRITNADTYRSLREIPNQAIRLRVAEEAARGLALFGNLTEEMDPSKIRSPLPGYRDTEVYYNQLRSVLAGSRTLAEAGHFLPSDPAVQNSTRPHFLVHADLAEYRRRLADSQVRRVIDLALEHEPFAARLTRMLKSGELKKVAIHGDTKLDNFLFNTRTGTVKALVDLDTIMPHTWLSDWGDMVRSLTNIAGEREEDAEKIDADQGVLEVLARGFLATARTADSDEIDLMADAPAIMALELGVRFLTDYLRGDSYFRLRPGDPQDLNKTRSLVQFRLFERMRGKADSSRKIIETFCPKNPV